MRQSGRTLGYKSNHLAKSSHCDSLAILIRELFQPGATTPGFLFSMHSNRMKDMRVGIDISQVVFDGTGAATYTSALVNALLAKSNDDFVLFGASLRQKQKLEQFINSLPKKVDHKFVSIPPTLLNILWNDLHTLSVEKFIGKVDIFHSSDATQPPSKAKKITTVHDLVAYHFPETLHPKQLQVQRRRLGWVKAEADAVIAVSQATRDDLLAFLGIHPEKISVVYEGVNAMFNEGVREDAEKIKQVQTKYAIPQEYILSIGTMQPRKNLSRLVTAFKQLENPPTLIIGGSVGWGKKLEQAPNVILTGFIKQQDLPYLYAGAKMFIYPALYEGFGLPVLEAMACGTPVVTANTSSLPEVGGDAAIYIDPKDMNSIAEGMSKALSMSETDYKTAQQKSIKQAAKFSWEKAATETLNVYRSLV